MAWEEELPGRQACIQAHVQKGAVDWAGPRLWLPGTGPEARVVSLGGSGHVCGWSGLGAAAGPLGQMQVS